MSRLFDFNIYADESNEQKLYDLSINLNLSLTNLKLKDLTEEEPSEIIPEEPVKPDDSIEVSL